MRIHVRILQGQTFMLEVQSDDTVRSVKDRIQNEVNLRWDLQRLLLGDTQLDTTRSLASYGIVNESTLQLIPRSAESSKTAVGGFGQGNGNNELGFPYGLVADDDQTILIADWGNHRIVQWKIGDMNGKVVAGGHGQGNGLNQLSCPTDLLIDRQTNSLIISDRGNNRVVRWSRDDGTTEGEILYKDIACWGLAMDDEGFLYISDIKNDEVRRYQMGQENGTLVAGGHGRGNRDNQLNEPNYIFVDRKQAVYVSDTWNHRVMKYVKGETKGTKVFSGSPRGLFVDASENIYVADYGNHRLIRRSKEDTVVATGNGKGGEDDHLYYPWGLSFNQNDLLFVADHSNYRVQRFPVKSAQ